MAVLYTLTYKIRRDIRMWYTRIVLKIGRRTASESSWNCFFARIPQNSRGQRRYLQHAGLYPPPSSHALHKRAEGQNYIEIIRRPILGERLKKTKKKRFELCGFYYFFFFYRPTPRAAAAANGHEG